MGLPLPPLELELQPVHATLLGNVLDALTDTFSAANFDFSRAGCEVQALDASGVALVALLLRADAGAFVRYRYRCRRDDLSVGLNVAAVAAVLRCADKDDFITVKSDALDDLTVTFESPKNGETSHFYFDVVAVDGVPFQLQETSESEYQAVVRMPSAQFMRISKKLSCSGEREDKDSLVIISVDKESVNFFASGKNGTSRIVCTQTPTTLVDMKEKVSLMFALRYIKSFSKASALCDQVTISLASKKLAVFESKIAGMGDIRYYVVQVNEDP